MTIHETSFFRNHEHYRALREIVLPDLAHRRGRARRLRIWSAGCATGEEAYSLAITCLEQPELAGWDIHLEASDLSEKALAVARRGVYPAPTRCVMSSPSRIAALVPAPGRGTAPRRRPPRHGPPHAAARRAKSSA